MNAAKWAIECRSNNRLDGARSGLAGRFSSGLADAPAHLGGYTVMVFATRAAARLYIEVHYGYIARRPDLHAEPHGWKMPRPVRVKVTVTRLR